MLGIEVRVRPDGPQLRVADVVQVAGVSLVDGVADRGPAAAIGANLSTIRTGPAL